MFAGLSWSRPVPCDPGPRRPLVPANAWRVAALVALMAMSAGAGSAHAAVAEEAARAAPEAAKAAAELTRDLLREIGDSAAARWVVEHLRGKPEADRIFRMNPAARGQLIVEDKALASGMERAVGRNDRPAAERWKKVREILEDVHKHQEMHDAKDLADALQCPPAANPAQQPARTCLLRSLRRMLPNQPFTVGAHRP